MTKKFAFTLAEVLIALAIIGVVAAMTIPTFMANTAGAQFKTGLKKNIAVLTQAAATNYATEGYNFDDTPGIKEEASGAYVPYEADTNDVVGFNTETTSDGATDLGRANSLFHIFQNNLNMKNSQELRNYAVFGTADELSCAGREGNNITYKIPNDASDYTLDQTAQPKLPGAGADGTLTDPQNPGRIDQTAGGTITDSTGVIAKMSLGGFTTLCDARSVADGGINQGRMFQLEDGAVVTWNPAQGYCTESNPCFGYIDVNGPAGPNRMIGCSESNGKQENYDAWILSYGRNAVTGQIQATCTVETKDITDIYPVMFYGSSVKPASLAAKAVLENTKTNQKLIE